MLCWPWLICYAAVMQPLSSWYSRENLNKMKWIELTVTEQNWLWPWICPLVFCQKGAVVFLSWPSIGWIMT
jgi:hypothetical protein